MKIETSEPQTVRFDSLAKGDSFKFWHTSGQVHEWWYYTKLSTRTAANQYEAFSITHDVISSFADDAKVVKVNLVVREV